MLHPFFVRHVLLSLLLLVICAGIHPPIIFDLTPENPRIALSPGLPGAGRIIDVDLVVCPPHHHEMPAGSPQSLVHQSDEVIALLQHGQRLRMVGVIRFSVGICPVQHIAFDAECLKLGLEVGVIGSLLQSFVAMLDRPLAGIHRREGFARERLNQHGRGGGATAGAADRGILTLHTVGLGLPAAICLEVQDWLLIHGNAPCPGSFPRCPPGSSWPAMRRSCSAWPRSHQSGDPARM